MSVRALLARLTAKVAPRALVAMTASGGVVGYGSTIKDLRGALPVSATEHYATRPTSRVEGVVWHHSATSATATFKSIAQFHVESRKWAGIAYHFAIDQYGIVYQLNDITTVTNQTAGYNSKTIGAVLIGNFENDEVPEAMERSMVMLNDYLKDEYHLRFAWMHGETKATQCPGVNAVRVIEPYLYGPRPPSRK